MQYIGVTFIRYNSESKNSTRSWDVQLPSSPHGFLLHAALLIIRFEFDRNSADRMVTEIDQGSRKNHIGYYDSPDQTAHPRASQIKSHLP